MSVPLARLTEIPPRSGTALVVPAGAILTIVDPEGEQVADFIAFDRADPTEWLSSGRTFDYAETLRPTVGHAFYSNRSRPLATIVRDDVGVHDFLLTPCSRDTWRICYGDEADESPGCFGNLAAALAPYGIGPDAIPTTFNVFMNVQIAPDGRIAVLPPKSRAGDVFAVRAERDLIVGLTACSAPASNNGSFKPIRYMVQAEAAPRMGK
jgi:uncharacterized protein YcgI (DUF1989 family)